MGAPAGIATDRIVWAPDEATVEAANVTRLMRAHGIADLADLQRRSQDPDWFWPAVIDDLGLRFDEAWERVVDASEGPAHGRAGSPARGSTSRSAASSAGRPRARERPAALMADRARRERRARLRRAQPDGRRSRGGAARARGGGGDTVGVFMPLAPQTAAALYVRQARRDRVPIFSGFGAEAVAPRLDDAGARVLVTVDGFTRRGKRSR